MTPRQRKPKGPLVTTDLAATYIIMISAGERVVLMRENDIKAAKRRVWNAARDGKLTRYGGTGKGEARWCLKEVHTMFAPTRT